MENNNHEFELKQVVNNVNNYNLRRLFCPPHGIEINDPLDHFDRVFNPVLFDYFAGKKYEFYKLIGYWSFVKKYEELILHNTINMENVHQILNDKIKENFCLCYQNV